MAGFRATQPKLGILFPERGFEDCTKNFMENLTKSLKSYVSQAKQQPIHREEEKQALLHHHNDCHMVQSSISDDQIEEVIVKIDSGSSSAKGDKMASKSSDESPSSKFIGSSKNEKLSFEGVLNQAVRQRRKDSLYQPCLSASFEENSWRLLVNKAKSRLIDLPDQDQYQRTQRTLSSDGEDCDHKADDIEDIPEEHRNMKHRTSTTIQWVSLVLIIAALVCSISIRAIKRQKLWDLPLWKWEIMVFAIICGHLVSGWGIKLGVIFIERNFLMRKRVLYFVYGLRRPVQNCLWLGLVLVVWLSIFTDKVEEGNKSKILLYGTKILVCFFVGTLIWLLKTLLVKVLASSFHVNAFFDRIQEALFNQYVIETLSGPPLFERQSIEEEEGRNTQVQQQKCATVGKRSRFYRAMTTNKKDEEISIHHVQKLNQKNIATWNMRMMINIVRHGTLSTLDERILNSDLKDDASLHIRSECQAKEAAKKIFHNVAKRGYQQIFLDDMMRFMDKEEALRAMHLIGFRAACENEGINKPSLKNWLVNAFRERKALALSLNDTKTAVDELHNMLNILVGIIIMIVWLIIVGIPITHFLVFVSSQLLLVVFIFGNTCKTVFEAIIFLFIMHPFDVGDRCQVDGVQMVVEEMNILTTVFLMSDNQKIIYPNSVLATKPIGNFYRSPDMTETIDFCIHISTPMEKIARMKDKIKGYVEENRQHWHPHSMVVVTDVEDMNKIKMSLWVTHRMNYQQTRERWARRTLLLEEMIKMFKELDIEYRTLPLDVNVQNLPPLVSNRLPSNWTTCAN